MENNNENNNQQNYNGSYNEQNNNGNYNGSYNQPNMNGNYNQPNMNGNYNQQPYNPNYNQQPYGNVPTQKNNKAVASLVLGIVSAVCIFFGYGALIGIVCAIVGIVLGINAKKEEPNNSMAKAGVILSVVSLGLCVLSFIACVACLGSLASYGAFEY